MKPVSVPPAPSPKRRRHLVDPAGVVRVDYVAGYVRGMAEPEGGWGRLAGRIRSGAYDEYLNEGSPVYPTDDTARTPTLLCLCTQYADPDVVRALLERGAHPNVCAGFPDMAVRQPAWPLEAAVFRGSVDLVRMLLDYGAR